VDYKAIDITEPGNEEERDYFKENCKKRDPEPIPHPPQFFNDNKYCGVCLVSSLNFVLFNRDILTGLGRFLHCL
jgi:hypothetical protein